MSQVKVFHRGDVLCKEGDRITSIYIIQSGAVSQCLIKNKKNIELFQLNQGSVIGELALLGLPTFAYTSIAVTETKVLEIPYEIYRTQIDSLPAPAKSLVKNLVERLKNATTEIKNFKFEKDNSACPEDQVAKIFGSLCHAIKNKGTYDDKTGWTEIDWNILKQYAFRIFGEPSKRVEFSTQIMIKLKLAEYIMEPVMDAGHEGKMEITGLRVFSLSALESFFEFYQYYYFKGGKMDLLRVNEEAFYILKELLQLVGVQEPDRQGVVSIEFERLVKALQDSRGIELSNNHFTLLESKGLFMKRKSLSDGKVLVQFDHNEFRTQIEIWRFLREIEKLNERGYVDMLETEEAPKKKIQAGFKECSSCKAKVVEAAKFCNECGAKLVSEDKKAA